MAQSIDKEQTKYLDVQWAATKKDDKISPEEHIDDKVINWLEEWSSGHKYKYIWWEAEGGEVLKVVFQDPDSLHIASLYSRKLAKEVAEGKRQLHASNMILWALHKLRVDTKDPKAIKRVLYYCIMDENLQSERLKTLIDAAQRTDQTALLKELPDLMKRGIIAAAIRAFGEPSKLFLGGEKKGAQIVIEFPVHK